MAWNPSPEIAVARDAARKLSAEIGCVIIHLRKDTLGMVSFGQNIQRCKDMGRLGDHLYDAAMKYYAEGG